jgi:Carboxypeptidase regulatory-like domain
MKSPLFGRSIRTLGLLVLFLSQGAWALAGTSGGISGIITDATTGLPIPGVRLRISSPSETVTTTTDARGHFIVFSLQPDDYTITAVKEGYDARSVAGETVSADQTQRYDLQLSPSGSSQASPQPHRR